MLQGDGAARCVHGEKGDEKSLRCDLHSASMSVGRKTHNGGAAIPADWTTPD